MDGEDCEMAAESLELTYISKFEDKSTRAGCFFSPGFSNGVFFNGHPEAPTMDDHIEYSTICRLETSEPTLLPTEESQCDMVCMDDLDRLEKRVDANAADLGYLTEDVPTVLANTFTTVNDLEKMVEDLKAEVERLSKMVTDHHERFSCLAGMDKEDDKED